MCLSHPRQWLDCRDFNSGWKTKKGLPVGLQIIGPRLAEEKVLQLAKLLIPDNPDLLINMNKISLAHEDLSYKIRGILYKSIYDSYQQCLRYLSSTNIELCYSKFSSKVM